MAVLRLVIALLRGLLVQEQMSLQAIGFAIGAFFTERLHAGFDREFGPSKGIFARSQVTQVSLLVLFVALVTSLAS